MTLTYDVSTDRGKVRLIIQDTVEEYEFFDDGEIDAFLDMEDSIGYAAAAALDAWASNEALVTKAVKLLDIATNGPAVAKALRIHADKLRELADSADAGFDIAEMALGHFSVSQQLLNEALDD